MYVCEYNGSGTSFFDLQNVAKDLATMFILK